MTVEQPTSNHVLWSASECMTNPHEAAMELQSRRVEIERLTAELMQARSGLDAAALDALQAERDRLRAAGIALYMAGRWSIRGPSPMSAAQEAKLWEDLRDALGLAPGTATAAGMGAASVSESDG